MKEIEAWIKLSLARGVGDETLKQLINNLSSPVNVIQADEERIKELTSSEIAKSIRECVNIDVDKSISLIESLGVKLIPFTSDEYPERLKNLPYSPPLLYIRGELKDNEPSIAIVGSRRASHYGKIVAERFARDIARVGLTVVSGLARGIDTCAHKGAVDEGGRTIAVLGCGIDRVYPSENVNLLGKIINNGACISEFPIGTQPFAGNFPRRNRIISGLSDAILVVEATMRSGTFSTVQWALEQGKEVFAVPGNITEETSKGTNKLIMDGARPVTNTQDIIDGLKMDRVITKRQLPKMTEEEMNVYERLGNQAVHIDELAISLSIPVSRLSGLLLSLELKSIVKILPGRYFIREQ